MNLKEKQREVLAQFYSNFALAWLTFGIINPIFNPPSSTLKFIVAIFLGLGAGAFFLNTSLKFFKY